MGSERLGACHSAGPGTAQKYVQLSPFGAPDPGQLIPNVLLFHCHDASLHQVVKMLNLSSVTVHDAGVASTSRGLVGDTVFAVLPNVVPWHTFAATVACQAVRRPIHVWSIVFLTLNFSKYKI